MYIECSKESPWEIIQGTRVDWSRILKLHFSGSLEKLSAIPSYSHICNNMVSSIFLRVSI